MRAFVKIIGIAFGLTGLLGGALLSMGHLRTAEGGYQDLELAKLKNLAATWEGRLLSARSAFRDVLLRHNVADIVEHPSEWAAWRVENKFSEMVEDWPTGLAKPRSWVLLRSNGETHALNGDSLGLSDALTEFALPDAPDILLSDQTHGPARCLALQYAPLGDVQNPAPGRLIALMDPQELFKIPFDPPAQWVLMNGPKETFLASANRTNPPIGAGTWGLLLSQNAGMVAMEDGLPLAFCRIHVPGMLPLLVVSEINSPTTATSAIAALLLITAGTACLALTLRPRRKTKIIAPVPNAPTVQSESDEPKAVRETITSRQIFQAMSTPLCVVDSNGKMLRVNSAARDLLVLSKTGEPDDAITVIGSDYHGSLKEFLVKAATPEFSSGSWLLCHDNNRYFDGEIRSTRLPEIADGSTPVALEFIENRAVKNAVQSANSSDSAAIDSLNPQPILLINDDGRVTQCNLAALDINAKLADSPLLHEVLPGLEQSSLPALADPAKTKKFESLFGSRMFEFYPVSTPNGMLLYGLKKSDSQSLQIALHQAQENFNTLCSLCTEAVLLVDPRTYAIQEANLSASDLLGVVHPGLIGKNMDEFADWPWLEEHLRASVQLQRSDGQCFPCSFEHELVKIEGEPTLLVVVSKLFEEEQRNIHDLADYTQSVAEKLSESLQREPEAIKQSVQLGPGMLVVTNPTVRDVARRMLERLGHSCEVFTNLDDATIYLVRSDVRPEFVMIDMGDFDQPGDWIEMVRSRCGSVPCVGLSESQDEELPAGPNAVLPKPFELEDIVNSLQSLDLDSAVEA